MTKQTSGHYAERLWNDKEINKIIKFARNNIKCKYDTFVGSGISGIMAAHLAKALHKELILVRKSGEISHGGCALNGFVSGENIIIVDDFIASGETMIYLLGHTKSFTLRREKMSSIV